MMRGLSDLTKPSGVRTIASLNSIMVDAAAMWVACMVPVNVDSELVRRHDCVDSPEIDSPITDWDGFIPRFHYYRPQAEPRPGGWEPAAARALAVSPKEYLAAARERPAFRAGEVWGRP